MSNVKVIVQPSNVEVYAKDEEVEVHSYSGLPGITNLTAQEPLNYNQSTETLSISLGTASQRNVPVSGNATADEVVLGSDSRLIVSQASTMPFGIVTDVPGHYLVSMGSNVVNQIIPAYTIFYCPIWLSNDAKVDRIAIEVASAASASGVIRLGLYAADSNGLPGLLVQDAGTVDSTTVGVKQAVVDQTLVGLNYIAVVSQNAVSSVKSFTTIMQAYPSPTTGAVSAGKLALSSTSTVTGLLPYTAPAPFVGLTYYTPVVNLRLAA